MSKYLGKSNVVLYEEIDEPVEYARKSVAGIDIHSGSYWGCHRWVNEQGLIDSKVFKVGVGQSDMDKLRDWFLSRTAKIPIELVVCESTGPYGSALTRFLRQYFSLCQINPAEYRRYGKKDDKFDARKMCFFALQGLFMPSFLPLPDEYECQMLGRAAIRCGHHVIDETTSLESFLISLNVHFTRGDGGLRMRSVSAQKILDEIVAGQTDPVQAARAASYYTVESKVEQLLYLVDHLAGVQELSADMREAIQWKRKMADANQQTYVLMYEKLKAKVSALRTVVNGQERTGAKAIELLQTIPSIGEKAAVFLLAELGLRFEERFAGNEPEDFDRPIREHVVGLCGFSPRRQYSGDKQTSKQKGTAGRKHVRRLLTECAQSLMKSNCPMGDKYRNIERRNGGRKANFAHNLAVGAAGAGLAKVMYWVVTRQQPYSLAKYDFEAVIKDKQKQTLRTLGRLEQNIDSLLVEKGNEQAIAGLKTAIGKVIGLQFQLQAGGSCWETVEQLFDKRTASALLKARCQTFGDVWMLLSNGQLSQQKGIGEKTHKAIVDTLVRKGLIQQL